jgi:hypothetical protein
MEKIENFIGTIENVGKYKKGCCEKAKELQYMGIVGKSRKVL